MRCFAPLVLACALVAGCVANRAEVVVSHYEAGEAEPAEPGAIDLYIAVAERPIGDGYVNGGLWEFADEQTPFQHDLERKQRIDANGFRVGLLGGSPDADLQHLLAGKNCPSPRCTRIQPGAVTYIDLGGLWPACTYALVRKDREYRVEQEQAQCRLQLLAHPDGDNKVRLVVTPTVRHGQQTLTLKPVLDPDGARRWDQQLRHPEEIHGWMNWTVSLGASDSLIIGGRLDRPTSLGHRTFLYTATEAPVQRVVVLRALRSGTFKNMARKRNVVPSLAAHALGLPSATSARLRGVAPE